MGRTARMKALSRALLRRQRCVIPASRGMTDLPAATVREPNDRDPKTFVVVELVEDKPGGLSTILELFQQHDTNVTHIESKLKSYTTQGPMFYIDFEGETGTPKVQQLLAELDKHAIVKRQEPREVPWFPVNIRELDLTKETLGGGMDGGDGLINEDHPGFTDEVYMQRRKDLAKLADDFCHGKPLPHVDYTDDEKRTWGAV